MNYPSQEESDFFKAGLYFSIQPDKIRRSEIFTTFEKNHRSCNNNLKFEETKSQIKVHLSYLVKSYFCNYKPSSQILRQHRVLRNFRKNKDVVISYKLYLMLAETKKTFLTKMNMINFIPLILLLLVSMVLLKCTNFPPVIHFLNSVRLFDV